VIRRLTLDLTRACAWPTPFQMSGQPADKQAQG
jgi:hypothetical protein